MRRISTITALAAFAIGAMATPSAAQNAARQQQAMQRSMAQTQQMIQRMNRVQERAHQLGQQLVMQMEQTRAREQQRVGAAAQTGQGQAAQAQAGQAQANQARADQAQDADAAQAQVRDQNRVRNQQRVMLQMTEAIGSMAGQCRNLLVQSEDVDLDEFPIQDRDMERDLDQLRQRLGGMATDMESSLEIMERMNQRIEQVALAD